MKKLKRILLLVNLLNHRHHVTFKTIKKICGIPERTAYRYINEISEANIPVYFDKKLRAYRLNQHNKGSIIDMKIEDAIFIIVGLKLLSKGLNIEYQSDIDNLIRNIFVQHSFPIEDVLQTYEHQIEFMPELKEYSELISSILINAAINCNKKVHVITKNQQMYNENLKIGNPSLLFKKIWQLTETEYLNEQGTSVSNIKNVKIIN